ncbi:Scr1 family TA system antitoxin-like transcriptional regulator [Streptomyces sp. NPDC060194]|uniref:helix-turn-helix domain-containing protein n=1 Tax=Streptomyces sp. NPDC060194 TaxID=3347069 RepID=UPI00365534CA
MSGDGPSAARRHTGELIKAFRRSAGLTQRQLADRLLVSESLQGAYERAERIPSREYLTEADRVLNAFGAVEACAELMDAEKYPPQFQGWARLEADAMAISAYECMLVPGLLQPEGYARELFGMRVPAHHEEEVERFVQARLDRQAVLRRQPLPIVGFVVEQAVFERPLGGVSQHRKTLGHILECIRAMPHLVMQVMPTHVERHVSMGGAMQLLTTSTGKNLVYADRQLGGTLLSRPDEVAVLMERFGTLRAQALNPAESVDLIERIASKL